MYLQSRSTATNTSSFSEHNIFINDTGDVFSFGFNAFGQCAAGNSMDVHKPTKIMNNPNIRSIVLGVNHSFLIEKNGTLLGCGNNRQNQLGIFTATNPFEFIKITSQVKKLATAYSFTLIQKDDNTLFFSGNGLNMYYAGFVEVDIRDVVSFSCGGDHALFLKSNGEVWVLGSNKYGQCGFPREESYIYLPRLLFQDKNIVSICCGYEYSFIHLQKENKSVIKCFGRNDFGQLGVGDQKNHYSLLTLDNYEEQIISIHASVFHTFLLLKNGDVLSTGFNGNGQLCLGKFSINTLEFTRANINDISHITTGYCHSIFINKNKQIFAAGNTQRLGMGEKDYRNYACEITFDGMKLIQNIDFVFGWTPQNHQYSSKTFRDNVETFILCLKRKYNSTKEEKEQKIYKLPKPILFLICNESSL